VVPLGAVAIVATMLVVGKTVEPARFAVGYAPSQPVAFSHRVHAGENRVPCLYCHTNADRSRNATIPAVQTCMNCHRYISMADSAVIDKAVVARLKTDAPMPWVRVYKLPDHVFFDHRSHVDAGVQCETCHGDVKSMDVLTRVMDMRMGKCMDCHRSPRAYLPPSSPIERGPTDCTACHR
jgi:Cytochrome c7 and related cytochrome c/Class III cytochrome C family